VDVLASIVESTVRLTRLMGKPAKGVPIVSSLAAGLDAAGLPKRMI